MKFHGTLSLTLLLAVAASLVLSPGTRAEEPSTGRLEIKLVSPPGVDVTEKVDVALAPLMKLPWRPTATFKVDGSGGTVDVRTGRYVLQCGQRNPSGDVFLLLETIDVKAGETVTVTIQGGLPCEEGGRLPIARVMGPAPSDALRGTDRKMHTLARLLAKGPLLLVFFSLENEPSQRILPEILAMETEAEEARCSFVGVHVQGGPSAGALGKACRDKGMALPLVLLDEQGEWSEAFRLSDGAGADASLPTIVAFDGNGEVVFRWEGYDLNVRAKIGAVLRKLSEE